MVWKDHSTCSHTLGAVSKGVRVNYHSYKKAKARSSFTLPLSKLLKFDFINSSSVSNFFSKNQPTPNMDISTPKVKKNYKIPMLVQENCILSSSFFCKIILLSFKMELFEFQIEEQTDFFLLLFFLIHIFPSCLFFLLDFHISCETF